MAFNISEFSSMISKRSVALSDTFDVQISRQSNISGTTGSTSNFQRELSFRTETFEIPGRRIATIEQKYYGIRKLIGYDAMPTEVSFNVVIGEDLAEKIFFEEWQDEIVGRHRTEESNPQMFDLGFYDDYAKNSTVTVYTYDVTGKRVHEHILLEAYPINISGLSMSWMDTNIMRMNVTLGYRYYKNKIL